LLFNFKANLERLKQVLFAQKVQSSFPSCFFPDNLPTVKTFSHFRLKENNKKRDRDSQRLIL